MGRRQRWLVDVLSPDLDSFPVPLQAREKLFQGASLVFIPHLSPSQSQSCLSLEPWAAPFQGCLHLALPQPPHTHNWARVPLIVSYGNQSCGAPGGTALLPYSFSSSEDRDWAGQFLAVRIHQRENGTRKQRDQEALRVVYGDKA